MLRASIIVLYAVFYHYDLYLVHANSDDKAFPFMNVSLPWDERVDVSITYSIEINCFFISNSCLLN